jgi:uncharacterized protein
MPVMAPPEVAAFNPSAPVSSGRIAVLDVLRGVAVAGILLANVLTFFGWFIIPPETAASLPTAAADGIAYFLERVLIEGKFYSIFSLLFGIGFGVQLARGGDEALPRFRRRLRILLAIGAIHALFIWAGDILMLYALLGFTMPWFARKTDRSLLRWSVALLAMPAALYVVALAGWALLAPASPPPDAGASEGPPQFVLEAFAAMGTGGVAEAFRGNLILLVGRWADLFATMRFPKVLGMFVLGLWAVRTGLALLPADHRPTLRRWALIGIGVGLPVNLLSVWAFDRWEYLPPSAGGLLGVAAQGVGFPLLAIGYACTVALAVVGGRRLLDVFAPVGRMALTNYLMHSVVCVVLAYGFGFGLWWRVGASTAMGIAAAVILVQIPLSAWWLSRHRFGPVEWVWRRLTYGRAI